MKKIVILSTYPSNDLKINTLIDCINSVKKLDFDILLCSHLSLDTSIQSMVDYYIYDSKNYLLPPNMTTHSWFKIYDLHFRINRKGHELAISRNISNSLNLVSSLGYDFFIFLESDNIFSDLDLLKILKIYQEMLENDKKLFFFKPSEFREYDSYVYETLIFGGSPIYFLNKLKLPIDLDSWVNSEMMPTFETTFYKKFSDYENDFLIINCHSSEFFNTSQINIFRYGTFIFDLLYNEINDSEAVLLIHNMINHNDNKKIKIYLNNELISEELVPTNYWRYFTFKLDGSKLRLIYEINDVLQDEKTYILNDEIKSELLNNGTLSRIKNENKKVDVICLCKTSDDSKYEMTKNCLRSIIDSENDIDFNIFLLESNPDSSYDYSEYAKEYIKPNFEFNYNAYLNYANDYIKNDWVVVTNNDVIYEKNWFTEILKVYNKDNSFGSFSPFDISHFEKYFPNLINDNIDYYEGYEISKFIHGWSISMTKSTWSSVYPFDENFKFYYQDNDYSETIKNLGIKHALVKNSKSNHLISQTTDVKFGIDNSPEIKESELTFINKWFKI